MLVTTPKLLPAPRMAQNKSGESSAVTRELTVGGDHLDSPDVVGAEPETATEDPDPPAERVGNGTHRRRRAGQRGKAEGRRGLNDLGPLRPPLQTSRAIDRIHIDRGHPAGVDQQPPVDSHGRAVPSGLHADRELVGSGEADGGHDIVGRGGAHDQGRTLRNGKVEAGVLGGVTVVAGNEHRPGHLRGQAGQVRQPRRTRQIGRGEFIGGGHHVL